MKRIYIIVCMVPLQFLYSYGDRVAKYYEGKREGCSYTEKDRPKFEKLLRHCRKIDDVAITQKIEASLALLDFKEAYAKVSCVMQHANLSLDIINFMQNNISVLTLAEKREACKLQTKRLPISIEKMEEAPVIAPLPLDRFRRLIAFPITPDMQPCKKELQQLFARPVDDQLRRVFAKRRTLEPQEYDFLQRCIAVELSGARDILNRDVQAINRLMLASAALYSMCAVHAVAGCVIGEYPAYSAQAIALSIGTLTCGYGGCLVMHQQEKIKIVGSYEKYLAAVQDYLKKMRKAQ